MKKTKILMGIALTSFIAILMGSCGGKTPTFTKESKKQATKYTQSYNKALSDHLNWDDKRDFTTSTQGKISDPVNQEIMAKKGGVAWSFSIWDFEKDLKKEAPETVNPSLWRVAKLNANAGLFEVLKGKIYQIRSFDLATMSIVVGKKGYIVIDPLISAETAKAGFDLVKQKLGDKPLVAVIYSHSHVDHFGGVRGIVDEKDVQNGKVQIFAPKDFMNEAISENIFAGNAMGRRASYMYGNLLTKDPYGAVGGGLGKTTSAGDLTLIPPTTEITYTGEKRVIDGLHFEFIWAPHTEAPTEMLFYISEFNAACFAEDATHTQHNLYTLRGAKTRSAKAWSATLTDVLKMWGDKIEIEFNSHHWPEWGNRNIVRHIESQRAMYKYLNDQTLHYANMGYDMTTTAEIMNRLPKELNDVWSNQGYYGSVNHNVKATWDLYLGWFDGNPANLHQLPMYKKAKKYVEYMGGADEILKKAYKAYQDGEYRWVAEVVNYVVQADPKNKQARYLLADAEEQMGYQSVSGPWRNFYLSGAKELREGVKVMPTPKSVTPDIISAMTMDMIFEYMSILVDAQKAQGKEINFKVVMPDLQKTYALQLKYSCLNYLVDSKAKIDFTLVINKADLNKLMLKEAKFEDMVKSGKVKLTGNPAKLEELKGVMTQFNFWWNIVTPNLPIPAEINPIGVDQK